MNCALLRTACMNAGGSIRVFPPAAANADVSLDRLSKGQVVGQYHLHTTHTTRARARAHTHTHTNKQNQPNAARFATPSPELPLPMAPPVRFCIRMGNRRVSRRRHQCRFVPEWRVRRSRSTCLPAKHTSFCRGGPLPLPRLAPLRHLPMVL